MSATLIVQEWRTCVASQLLPNLHGHQAKALADFSYAAVLAGHCQAGRLELAIANPGFSPGCLADRRADRKRCS